MQNNAATICAYVTLDALLTGEAPGGGKASLPGSGGKPVTGTTPGVEVPRESRTAR
jgi:hypothetical protein